MSQFSLNNRIVVEAYKTDKSLKSKVSNGFATMVQKTGLVGLTVLMGTKLSDGREIKAGDIAYIREQTLHATPWGTSPFECEVVAGPFLIVELSFVDFIVAKEGLST